MSYDLGCGPASCALGQQHFKVVALVEKTLPTILKHNCLGLVMPGGGVPLPTFSLFPWSSGELGARMVFWQFLWAAVAEDI